MIEPANPDEEFPFDAWDETDDEFEPVAPPPWRRPLLIGTAAITAIALAILPIYNVFFARSVADNGLEVCGFDYCIVQDAVREAGLDLTMSRLSTVFLDEPAARSLADELTAYLEIEPIHVRVVDDLEGRLGGVYDDSARTISIERPARAWTVLHEVAHALESGHGDEFQEVLIDLAVYMESDPNGD